MTENKRFTINDCRVLSDEQVLKILNQLTEENEHIKQTIKDMINTERTEIGKMTLRHLWRQIQ